MISDWKTPPFLRPGDTIKVITPSGALKELTAFEKGLEIWRSRGYQVELSRHWNAHYGYLGGTDQQRRDALLDAWQTPQYQALVCTRGGYGSSRLLETGDWTTFCANAPKWIIGFSDITSLLWNLAVKKVSSIHGPVLTTLASEPDWSIQRLFDYLEGGSLAPLFGQGWGGGQGKGHLLPANLTVATHLLGTPLQPSLEGVILAFEDVSEAPYRIDRQLTQWRLMDAFKGVQGIALGRFSRCDRPSESSRWTVEDVLRDRLGDLGIPIVSDLPFGHDGANAILPVGMEVILDGDQGSLTFISPKS